MYVINQIIYVINIHLIVVIHMYIFYLKKEKINFYEKNMNSFQIILYYTVSILTHFTL